MKKAIVVGASSGIGKELAILLAKNDFKVGITARRNDKLQEIKESSPNQFVEKAFDCVSDDLSSNLNDLVKELDGLDLFILSSGTGDLNEQLDFNIENQTNQLNVIAFTEMIDWAYNYFKTKGSGHIVGISSIAALRGSGAAPAYNASKAYQSNYLEGIRQKATKAKLNITVSDIRPGFVDTDMAKGDGLFWVASKEKAGKQILKAIKAKRGKVYVSRRWRLIALILKLIPSGLYKKM